MEGGFVANYCFVIGMMLNSLQYKCYYMQMLTKICCVDIHVYVCIYFIVRECIPFLGVDINLVVGSSLHCISLLDRIGTARDVCQAWRPAADL